MDLERQEEIGWDSEDDARLDTEAELLRERVLLEELEEGVYDE